VNSTHRHVIDARRPIQYGGGACNLLLLSSNDRVELLFHATPQTGAVMTPTQAIELAQALITAAENHQSTAPHPPPTPSPRVLTRQRSDHRDNSADALEAMASDRVDNRRRRTFVTRHLTAVVGQQVITDPALLARGHVTQESPGAPIARGITQVLGTLIMHALASLDARIAWATAQGHSVSREAPPTTEIPRRITDPTGNDRGRPHPGILRRWGRRLRTRRDHRDYRGNNRGQRPTGHPYAEPRHTKVPL
jgi:hypothetical protein